MPMPIHVSAPQGRTVSRGHGIRGYRREAVDAGQPASRAKIAPAEREPDIVKLLGVVERQVRRPRLGRLDQVHCHLG